MKGKAAVFEENYQHYLKKIAALNPAALADRLGFTLSHGKAVIPFFNRSYRVSAAEIVDAAGRPAPYGVSIILFKYLLMCPPRTPTDRAWAAYRDFPDAAPLLGTFAATAERPIAEHFSGRTAELMQAALELGASAHDGDYPYDLKLCLSALPRIPMLLLFDDADEEFSSRCKILFERRIEKYLDMECVAMLGMLLAEFLRRAAGGPASGR
jgi:hypothetical protein